MAGLLDFLMGGSQPQTQSPQPDMVQGILSSRFQPQQGMDLQPNYGDYSSAIMHSINGQPMGGADVATSRAKEIMNTLATIGAMQRTNLMMQGGPTGALINRYQAATGADFPTSLAGVKAPIQGTTMQGNQIVPIPGAPQAAGQMAYGKQAGEKTADIEAAAPIAANTEIGKQGAENAQSARANTDIVSQYNQLIADSQNAPSGALQSGIARLSNAANMPTEGAINQGKFDADLNNLYLATIRSLKGTGRVMEQELVKIAESAPKPTDSNEVKIAKAQAHMAYYQSRMAALGYDPQTGAPINQSANLGTQGASIPLGNNSNQGGPINLRGASDQQSPGKLIGTSGGKNVYELPDGTHVMEQ